MKCNMELFKIKLITPKEYIIEKPKQGLYVIKQDDEFIAYAKLFNGSEEFRSFKTRKEAKKWLNKKRQDWRNNIWQ